MPFLRLGWRGSCVEGHALPAAVAGFSHFLVLRCRRRAHGGVHFVAECVVRLCGCGFRLRCGVCTRFGVARLSSRFTFGNLSRRALSMLCVVVATASRTTSECTGVVTILTYRLASAD